MLWALVKGKVKTWLTTRALIVPEADLQCTVTELLKKLHLPASQETVGITTGVLRAYNAQQAQRVAAMVDKVKL